MKKDRKERIAVVAGVRSPFIKAGGDLSKSSADNLGTHVLKELLKEEWIDKSKIDEVIIGNVAQPAHAANIARVIALNAGLNKEIPAFTVHRNCASGMESVSSAAYKLRCNDAKLIIAGGTESMSNIPFLFTPELKYILESLSKAKTIKQKLKIIKHIKLKYLKPIIGLIQGLTDPTCNMIMGITAENIVREFKITREEQDRYSLESHQKAIKGEANRKEEICPIPTLPNYSKILTKDDGPRKEQTLEALAKLKPFFEKETGTVTVGNACPITDGAAMLGLMTETNAKKENLNVLGYINDFCYAGLDPKKMGLGPIYATHKLLKKTDRKLKDIDLIEINEAFAAQVIGNLKAFESKKFAEEELNEKEALGEIDPNKLNVNGGAIALGHPVGTSGTRLILTLLKELKRQRKQSGIATLCVGGGQGAAFLLESN